MFKRLSSAHKGIAFMILGMLVFSIINAIVKDVTQDYHPIQVVFFRCLFACVPCAITLTLRKSWQWGNVRAQWKFHGLRALLIAVGLTSLFTGISSLPLSNSMALYFSSSLFLVLLSPLILLEKVSSTQWGAVVLGFFGVLVIAQPQADASVIASLLVITGAFLESVYNLVGRRLSQHTNSLMLTFMGSLFPALCLLLILPLFWVTPGLMEWVALICLGLGGGIGQLCVTSAYEHAPAGTIAPMIYSAILWSIMLDLIIYQDFPSAELFIGCAIIIASGFIIIYQESRQRRKIAG